MLPTSQNRRPTGYRTVLGVPFPHWMFPVGGFPTPLVFLTVPAPPPQPPGLTLLTIVPHSDWAPHLP